MPTRFLLMTLACLSLFGLLMLSALYGCHPKSVPTTDGDSATRAGYVGNDACVACHAAEVKAHAGSRHALAMRAATPTSLGSMTPPSGPVPMAGYVLEQRGDRLSLARSIAPTGPVPLDLALGSGKVGITFISLPSPDTLLETHLSYFPAGKQWDYTPGHEVRQPEDGAFGRTQRSPDARRCLGCHSVTLPEKDLKPEPRFYGVGCEACHGPGQKHIEQIKTDLHTKNIGPDTKTSQPDSGMVALQKLSAQQLNDLCGKCHRTLKDLDVQSLAAAQTHRFQPYALTRSRCRSSDGSVLSCLTCHTPHDNVSTDIHRYEQICIGCHSPHDPLSDSKPISKPFSQAVSKSPSVASGKPCPVNRKDGCIHCHMRDRQSFPGLYWKPMVDHYISID